MHGRRRWLGLATIVALAKRLIRNGRGVMLVVFAQTGDTPAQDGSTIGKVAGLKMATAPLLPTGSREPQ